MSKAKTFKGGIHPSYNKDLSSKAETRELPLPAEVIIPLSMHIGAPAKCLVKRGDLVKTGQVIGEAGGFISAPVHASISGKVKAVQPVEHPMGKRLEAVIIEGDGKDEWIELAPVENPLGADKETLLNAIKAAGIVGMGGATFPSNVKLSPPANKPIDFVILNGAECEPYLTADHRIMLEKAEYIVKGLEIAARILNVKKLFIGIEVNKPDAIKVMRKALGKKGTVVPLEVKYPQGSEKQLISAITGREVPPKNLPMEVGAVVFNVGTAYAIYDAVYNGKPLLSRIVTVTGRGVKKPGNFQVRIGTSVAEVVEFSGGYNDNARQLILGGPMMGRSVATDGVPIIKGTGGILVLPEKEMVTDSYSACIRCGRCIKACPNRLNPQLLGSMIPMGLYDRIEELGIKESVLDYCFECGSCTYVCPAGRPLVQFFQLAKVYFRTKKSK
ncbi:electron transport complex subunit RsxC [Myxococcota bacterium]|nr:electron transport complex subunit RsxC [Myxococcota bacterium]